MFRFPAVRMVAVLALAGMLAGCSTHGQSRYSERDIGRSSVVEFGTVIQARQVDIRGETSGLGWMAGAAAGGIALSGVGQGSGNAAAILGGVIAGALLGSMAEQSMSNRVGIEYIVTLANGTTVTIVQDQPPEDRVFQAGNRVMVQTSGSYRRVLPADHLPTQVNRPAGITVVD